MLPHATTGSSSSTGSLYVVSESPLLPATTVRTYENSNLQLQMPALWKLRLDVSPIDDVRLPHANETAQNDAAAAIRPFAYGTNLAYVKILLHT